MNSFLCFSFSFSLSFFLNLFLLSFHKVKPNRSRFVHSEWKKCVKQSFRRPTGAPKYPAAGILLLNLIFIGQGSSSYHSPGNPGNGSVRVQNSGGRKRGVKRS